MKKNIMKHLTRTLALALALILTVGAFPTAKAAGNEDWMNNVLTTNPWEALSIKPEKIGSVTFLDDTSSAPRRGCWYMGAGASRSVLGWVQWNGGYADVYFAADGGVNAEKCANGLFKGCENLVEINFNGAFHTDHCTSMKEMFRDCKSLKYLDVSDFNTSNVTSMYAMFSTCTQLKELDVSGFDTSKVTNMGYMFSACRKLEEIDVSGFNTAKVSNMEGMFRWCDVIDDLELNSWNISRVRCYDNFMNPGMHINGRPWIEFFE